MILKVYQKYLTKEFVITSFKIIFIFFVLGFIMGILEEIKFFSDFEVPYYYPLYLVTLNIPSLIYEIFPFIFLITSQLYFLKLHEKNELHTFKINGLTNFKLLKIIITTSMILGFLIITIFYNFAATLKFQYLDIKKDYTKDNKYLATITENGLWIKDQIDDQITARGPAFVVDLLFDGRWGDNTHESVRPARWISVDHSSRRLSSLSSAAPGRKLSSSQVGGRSERKA